MSWRRIILPVALVCLGLIGVISIGFLTTRQWHSSTQECGSLLHPAEELRTACDSTMNRVLLGTLLAFVLTELILSLAGYLLARGTSPASGALFSTKTRVVLALGVVLSPLLLLPAQAVAFSSGHRAGPGVVLLYACAFVPLPLAVAVLARSRAGQVAPIR